MASFKSLVLTGIIAGFFIIAMINFVVQLELQENGTSTFLSDSGLDQDFSSLNTTITEASLDASGGQKSFTNSSVSTDTSDLNVLAIPSIIKEMFNSVIAVFNVIFSLPTRYLGFPPILSTLLIGFLIFTMVILGYRMIKSGV